MSYMHYGEPEYWEERYKLEQEKNHGFRLFDWYCKFDEVFPMIESLIDIEVPHRVLVIGCGRSNCIEVLYKRGFRDIHAIDISETVIFNMQERYADYSGVTFSVMDVRLLNAIPDKTYTLALDKACIDAVFCSSNFLSDTRTAFKEIYRVLAEGGIFISLSHASPPSRVPFLRIAPWGIDACGISYGENIHMFILTKHRDGEEVNNQLEGADAVVLAKPTNIVSDLGENGFKSSTTKNAGVTGFVTVTASVDYLTDMVNESEDRDS